MKNYACYKFACPQHNDAKRGTCPPSFIAFNQVDEMKVYFQDLGKTRGSCFIFSEVDTGKEVSSKPLFHFLNELDTR